ncbi:DUF192 domain-containing protein [bacterium]|nr:DUF192 domain-containing protein [bacterium]
MIAKKVFNLTRNCLLAEKAGEANSFVSRLIGLMGRKGLNKKEGLIILKTSSIHTFFMRFSIDVVFFNKKGEIIKIISELKPCRMSPWVWGAYGVIELPAGKVLETKTQKGDCIEIK